MFPCYPIVPISYTAIRSKLICYHGIMIKIVLSGGPSTGKSTVLKHLPGIYPEAYFIGEAAERAIKRQLTKARRHPGYVPILPTTHRRQFVPFVIHQQQADEAAIPKSAGLVFLDRCPIDVLGYLAFYGFSDYTAELREYVNRRHYDLAFFCDWLGAYEQTSVRREPEADALSLHHHLEAAYAGSGVPVVHLPPVPTSERLAIIKATINELGQTPDQK
jgi:predicted ATPase